MDRFGLAFKKRLSHFGWLRWVAGVNAVIIVMMIFFMNDDDCGFYSGCCFKFMDWD